MTTVCPKCLEEATILVDVNDGDTLSCGTCNEEYSLADVEKVVLSWGPVLGWLKAHPARQATGSGASR